MSCRVLELHVPLFCGFKPSALRDLDHLFCVVKMFNKTRGGGIFIHRSFFWGCILNFGLFKMISYFLPWYITIFHHHSGNIFYFFPTILSNLSKASPVVPFCNGLVVIQTEPTRFRKRGKSTKRDGFHIPSACWKRPDHVKI